MSEFSQAGSPATAPAPVSAQSAPDTSDVAEESTHIPSPGKKGAQPEPEKAEGTEIAEGEKPKGWKLKFKNQEKVVTSDDEIRALAQKGLLFDEVGRETAKSRKEAESLKEELLAERAQIRQILSQMKENPIEALVQVLGDEEAALKVIRPRVEQKILEEIEYEQNPGLKQQKELETRAQKAEAALKQREESEARQKEVAELNETKAYYEKQVLKMLDEAKIPRTPRAIKAWADQMYRYQSMGLEVDPLAIAERVRGGYTEDIQALGGEHAKTILDAYRKQDAQTILALGQELEQTFGPEVIKAIRVYDLTRLKAKRPEGLAATQSQQVDVAKSQPRQKQGYMDMDTWKEEARKRAVALQSGQAVKDW